LTYDPAPIGYRPDWRAARDLLDRDYGYHRYGGGCHVIPNHGLIILALLYGDGDWDRSMMIVNTCGWDTDCNSGNLGCLLGIRNGLTALTAKQDWRSPVADRIIMPTADGGGTVSYHYNAVSLLDWLTEPNGAQTTFTYDANGNRTGTTYPGGTIQTQTYDDAQRLATVAGRTSGGAPRSDIAVKARMPARLPSRSSLYASRRGSRPKQAPTSSPGPAITTATARNTAGSVSHSGGPLVSALPKKIS